MAITGAGISVASGLPLVTEMWAGFPIAKLFEESFYRNEQQTYFKLYRDVLRHWRTQLPNRAHIALAEKSFWVVTQNIDGLHRDAGTDHVLEIHGNLRELLCAQCSLQFGSWPLMIEESLPRCPQCSGVMEPAIVFTGQEIRHYSRAADWVGRAEVLWVVGTALDMRPVGHLPEIAVRHGAMVVFINEAADVLLPLLMKPPAEL